MSCRCCGSFLAPILAIGTLIAVGGAGYRAVSGDCPMCHADGQAKTTLVSTTTADACPYAPGAACNASAKTVSTQPEGCCPFMNSESCDQSKAGSCCHEGAAVSSDKVASTGK